MEASSIISEPSALAVHNNVTPSIRNSLTWLLASRAIVPAAIMISESLNLASTFAEKKNEKLTSKFRKESQNKSEESQATSSK